ncbi:unnamed protein product, partial [Amoebophrya sp. A120]|eukprot:GSA120T00001305001.1
MAPPVNIATSTSREAGADLQMNAGSATSQDEAAPPPYAFVTVGTTKFEQLIASCFDAQVFQTLRAKNIFRIVIQTGSGKVPAACLMPRNPKVAGEQDAPGSCAMAMGQDDGDAAPSFLPLGDVVKNSIANSSTTTASTESTRTSKTTVVV